MDIGPVGEVIHEKALALAVADIRPRGVTDAAWDGPVGVVQCIWADAVAFIHGHGYLVEPSDRQTWPRHLIGDCEIGGKVISVIADSCRDVYLPSVLQQTCLAPE